MSSFTPRVSTEPRAPGVSEAPIASNTRRYRLISRPNPRSVRRSTFVVAQGQVRDRSAVGAAAGSAGVMPATELLSQCAETPPRRLPAGRLARRDIPHPRLGRAQCCRPAAESSHAGVRLSRLLTLSVSSSQATVGEVAAPSRMGQSVEAASGGSQLVRWGSAAPQAGGRLSAAVGCAERTIRRSPVVKTIQSTRLPQPWQSTRRRRSQRSTPASPKEWPGLRALRS